MGRIAHGSSADERITIMTKLAPFLLYLALAVPNGGAGIGNGEKVRGPLTVVSATDGATCGLCDRMYCRYRLTDVGVGHVQAVVVLEVSIYYRTCYPAEHISTFPTEG
jgi:hypothetical protein